MPETMTLYQISDAREILETWLSETEGELTPELEAMLDELNGKADEKIERVALFIRETLANAEAIKTEEVRLNARRKAREKAAESLKEYLHREMDRLGKTKVQGLLATVAIQKNPPSVTCALDDAMLRMAKESGSVLGEFVREVPASYRIDRDAAMVAYKMGGQLPPEIVITAGSHVRIR